MDEREMRKVNLFVESELWRLVKIRAAERGVTATQVLNEAVRAYVGAEARAERPRRTRKGGRS